MLHISSGNNMSSSNPDPANPGGDHRSLESRIKHPFPELREKLKGQIYPSPTKGLKIDKFDRH